MKNLQTIADDLFNKIRGRFETLTIGDAEGNVTNVPGDARYFDFPFMQEGKELGRVSVSLDEADGVIILVSRDIVQGQLESVQQRWYDFLRELRIFAKKRIMPFDVRDINKSNLNKRDYKFLANNRSGDPTMSESKMYGTNKTSYQRIGNARLAIKHSAPINTESLTGRIHKIGAIFIEAPDGERYKYPFKHISGARAMARHVSEGGTAYDDFGKHISGLSEEVSKLRKFNQYIGRSAVMAETLSGYSDVVKERVNEVKKEIQNLQKEAYYKEAVSSYVVSIVEDIPDDVRENWIDQLTIKQFNEELADIFPYVYKLIGEVKLSKDLGPDDVTSEIGITESLPSNILADDETSQLGNLYVKFRTKQTPGSGPEGKQGYLIAFAGFHQDPKELTYANALRKFTTLTSKDDIANMIKKMMNDKIFVSAGKIVLYRDPSGAEDRFPQLGEFYDWISSYRGDKIAVEVPTKPERNTEKGNVKKRLPKGHAASGDSTATAPDKKMTRYFTIDNKALMSFLKTQMPDFMQAYYRPNFRGFVMDNKPYTQFMKFINMPNAIEQYGKTNVTIDQERSFTESSIDEKQEANFSGDDILQLQKINSIDAVKDRAIELISSKSKRPMQPNKVEWLKRQILSKKSVMDVIALMYDLLQSGEGNAVIGSGRSMGKNSYRNTFDSVDVPDQPTEKKKTPLGEFILSHFDRESGQFPKGKTAILTAVQKDYGNQFVKPATEFIERINNTVAERMGFRDNDCTM